MGLSTKACQCSTEDDKETTHTWQLDVATAQNATLQGESTAQQRTLPATLARRLVTGSRSAGSLTRPRMPTRNPGHNLNGRHGGRKRADEVGVSEGDPAFDEVMIHA